jgi:hypothetical protein
MKKSLNLIVFFALCIGLIGFASASIDISGLQGVYNLGDRLYVDLNLNPSSVSGKFEINLVCDGITTNIERFNAEKSFAVGVDAVYSTWTTLNPAFIGELKGTCNLAVLLGTEQKVSENFQVSNKIDLMVRLSKADYNPGELITFEIEAVKENGDLLEGFVDVTGAYGFSKVVEAGKASEVFSFPETLESGTYVLNVRAYDTDDEHNILNLAENNVSIRINQVASFVQISLSDLEALPGEDFEMGLEIFDQAGIGMNGTITSVLISPTGVETDTKISVAGETINFNFATNATAGEWKVRSSFESISEEKKFNVKSVPKVEVDFLDSLLIVRNVGNDFFNETIELKIADTYRELELKIAVGEERRFQLSAPDGEYNVEVNTGEAIVERNLLLTGKAIDVGDPEGVGLLSKYPLIWFFLLLVFGGAGIVMFLKYRGGATMKLSDKIEKMRGGSHDSFVEHHSSGGSSVQVKKKEDIIDLSQKEGFATAESSLVLKGEKQNSAIVSIRVEDYKKLGKSAKEELDRIFEVVGENKGTVEIKENHFLLVFNPLITKTFKNEQVALKVAYEVYTLLNEYNHRFKDKIVFNIGVNSGDLISEIRDKKLKYTSMGNTVLLAKKISDMDDGKLLISEKVKKSLGRDAHVEAYKKLGENSNVYSVSRFSDREENKEKLQDLLGRMKND